VLHAPSIFFSFIRSPDDTVGGQQVLREFHSRPTQYFTSSCTSVLNAQSNNPVREGVVCIVIGHHDSILGRGKKMSLLQSLRTGSGKRPASYSVLPVVRQSGHEADFSLPSSAKVEYSYTSSPPHTFMACTGTVLRSWYFLGSLFSSWHVVEIA